MNASTTQVLELGDVGVEAALGEAAGMPTRLLSLEQTAK